MRIKLQVRLSETWGGISEEWLCLRLPGSMLLILRTMFIQNKIFRWELYLIFGCVFLHNRLPQGSPDSNQVCCLLGSMHFFSTKSDNWKCYDTRLAESFIAQLKSRLYLEKHIPLILSWLVALGQCCYAYFLKSIQRQKMMRSENDAKKLH